MTDRLTKIRPEDRANTRVSFPHLWRGRAYRVRFWGEEWVGIEVCEDLDRIDDPEAWFGMFSSVLGEGE